MRLAQRAHGGYKRANILIIFRTANSEPCFLGLLSVTPENGACQHPVPLPTCFRTDSPRPSSPRPSSPGPSQQGPQSLPVPRLPSRSDPLRPGPFLPGRLLPGRFLPSRLLPGRFAPFGSHSGLRTISFRPSAGSFQRQLAVGPSSPINRLMAVRGLRPVRVAGGRRNCWGTIFVRPSSPLVAPCPVSTPRPDSKPRTSVGSDTSVVREIRNKCRIFRAVPRPGSYRLRRHFPRLCNCSTRVRHPYRARSLRSGNLRLQSEVHTYEPSVIRSTGLVTLPDPTLAVREATAGIHNSES